MASLNRWSGIGNIGNDVELKTTQGGKSVCTLNIACNESWKDANGDKQERVEWVKVSCWGKTAEICGKFLSKGRQIYVEGRLQTRKYQKDGQDHYATEVVADKVLFLGGGNGERSHGVGGGRKGDTGASVEEPSSVDVPPAYDDIPFLTWE